MRTFILFLFIHSIITAQTWIQLSDITTTKRDDGVAVIVGNNAYFGTGLQEWNATIDFRVLNLSSNTWTTIPNMPHTTERQYACAFPGNNCFYVFGGDGVGGALNTLFKYDIATASWNEMKAKPGNGLIGAACFVFGNKIIISGGKSLAGVNKEVWEYDISSDSWKQKKDINVPPAFRASFATLNNTGYRALGINSSYFFMNELYKYDPVSDNWTYISTFPQGKGRAYAAMEAFTDRLFIFGGVDSLGNIFGDSWNYIISNNSWIQGPSHPVSGRKGGMSVATARDFYYTCGISKEAGRLTETWRTDVPLSVNKITNSSDVVLSPQPAQDVLQIQSRDYEGLDVKAISIYKIDGSIALMENGDKIKTQINVSQLESGVYILRVLLSDERMMIKKFIKE